MSYYDEIFQVACFKDKLVLLQIVNGTHQRCDLINNAKEQMVTELKPGDLDLRSQPFTFQDLWEATSEDSNGETDGSNLGGLYDRENGEHVPSCERKSGWYLCEIDYDMIQFIFHWDEQLQVFHGNGGKGVPTLSQNEFAFISTRSLDLEKFSERYPVGSESGAVEWV